MRVSGLRALDDELRVALSDEKKVQAIRSSLWRLREARKFALSRIDNYLELRQRASKIRERTVENLDRYIALFTERIESQGGRVVLARTSEDADRLIAEELLRLGVRRVVKSKSMTAEELGLNSYLESNGIEVVDTDLGERAIQLAGDRPIHIVAPALHFTRFDFSRLFREKEGVETSPDPESLTMIARMTLRKRFLEADAAISGANFLIASTGSIVLVTNEGNGRLGPSVPAVYVVVAGVEKLVETPADAGVMLELLARSATGQTLTVYTTLTSGPQLMGHGVRQHLLVVLVDNGRLRAASSELAPALKCIRCAACLNTCPTFGVVGGHVFGDVYPGPMGILWTALVKGVEVANSFSELCISCGLCSSVCPVMIPVAEEIMVVKRARSKRLSERVLTRVASIERTASKLPRLWNAATSSSIGRTVAGAFGLDSRRSIPRVSQTLRMSGDPDNQSAVNYAYFSDVYAQFNEPRIGYELERVFREAGLGVFLPKGQTEAGMPYLSYGMVEKAKVCAERNTRVLSKFVKMGYEVVTTEPTALYILREAYPFLLKGSGESVLVAQHSWGAARILLDLVNKGVIKLRRRFESEEVFYHLPCHARATDSTEYVSLLQSAGYKISVSNVTCCGMGGTFGFKKGMLGYELSMAVSKDLSLQLEHFTGNVYTTDSSVCSMQLNHLGRDTVYPLSLIEVVRL
jgi:L-lactate dehydrogenase complex protein LldF